jgi:hypothetical protein
LPIR